LQTGLTNDHLIAEEINNKDGLTQFGNSQDLKLSPLNGLSQTLSAGHFNQPKIILECIGNLNQPGHNESIGRIDSADGLSPTITAKQGGGHEPKIITEVKQLNPSKESGGVQPYQQNRIFDAEQISPTIDTECNRPHYLINDRIQGWHENENVIAAHMGDEKRSTVQEHVYHKENGVMGCLNTAHQPKVISKYRIRRLTPLECWRLQGFSDESFYKAKSSPMSDSQLYKQAGNSMTTKVIKGVLNNILNCIFG